MCSHRQVWQNALHYEYSDGVLVTVTKLSVERWTLLTLNGHHLGYVAEGEGPPTYENGSEEVAVQNS